MNKYIIHNVSHTHWDREWYLPYETMRLRLVDMMDTLLGIMDSDSDYRYFTLDGQTVVLEDYLEIRPQMREKLMNYTKDGRILVGPWYTLPDEFLVSGEALIRNLLLGHRIASDFGRVMEIGYLPDMFGHISQLPQILCGFGISTAVLWRGIGGEEAEYILQGPDGSEVFLCRLEPERGYSNGHDILRQEGNCLPDLIAFKEKEAKRSKTCHLLLMNGSDHRFPDLQTPSILHKLNASLDDMKIIQSNLGKYINAVKREAKGIGTLCGEQRRGLKFAPVLSGVLSSRIYLKQKNETIQILLEIWVEPFSSINLLCDGNYRKEAVRQAWKYLLQNHAHDSICGCSIDEVQLDMEQRFSRVEEIGECVLSESLNGIVQNMNIPAQSIVVFNPLNWERGGWVNASVEFGNGEGFILIDGENEVPYEIISKKYINKVVLSPQIHIEKRVKIRIAFEANAVPAVGYKTYISKKGKMFFPSQIQSGDKWAENENLRVEIEKDGTLTILDKNTNELYKGLNYFEDSGDGGDEYNYSPLPEDASLYSNGTVVQIKKEEGPFFIRFRVKKKFRVPECLTRGRRRSRRTVTLEIESFVTLLASSRRVEVETVVKNKAKNHRLRVMFPANIKSSSFFTGSKFDCVERMTEDLPTAEDWVEKPAGTFPYDNFIDISSGKRGLAILANGVKEGELIDGSIIALTLLRCVGDLSRDDLATRRGHAGPAIPTPGAQCPGIYRFRYAILPHRDNWKNAGVLRESLEHSVGLRTLFNDQTCDGYLPERFSFLSITPPELILSAFKLAEDSDTFVLRLYNPTEKKIEGKIRLFKPPRDVYLCNLNEEKKRTIQVRDGVIPITVGGKEIVTLLLKPQIHPVK